MSDKLVYLPALIAPDSPVYFFVDAEGRATRVADIAAHQRAKQEELHRIKNLTRDAEIRQLEARESNLYQFPYTTRPATHRQIVTKTYEINGVKVSVRGDEPSIRSVLSVLRTYPPKGPVYITADDKEEFTDLTAPCGKEIDAKSVPEVGMERVSATDPHINVIMPGGQKFSGSGTLLFVTNVDGAANNQIFVPLFRDVSSGYYASLGGKIDMPGIDNSNALNLNILYDNAHRESTEESADLFHLTSDGQKNDGGRMLVDIDSVGTPHKYRSYIHYLKSPHAMNQIKANFDHNAQKVRRDANFGAAYLETDDVVFINLQDISNQTDAIAGTTDISTIDYANYRVDGRPIRVRGRTVRVLKTWIDKGSLKPDRKDLAHSLDKDINHLTS